MPTKQRIRRHYSKENVWNGDHEQDFVLDRTDQELSRLKAISPLCFTAIVLFFGLDGTRGRGDDQVVKAMGGKITPKKADRIKHTALYLLGYAKERDYSKEIRNKANELLAQWKERSNQVIDKKESERETILKAVGSITKVYEEQLTAINLQLQINTERISALDAEIARIDALRAELSTLASENTTLTGKVGLCEKRLAWLSDIQQDFCRAANAT